MPNKCMQEQRIAELENKIEYMERVIQALIEWKEDSEVIVYDEKHNEVWAKSKFKMLMESVWTYKQYRWRN